MFTHPCNPQGLLVDRHSTTTETEWLECYNINRVGRKHEVCAIDWVSIHEPSFFESLVTINPSSHVVVPNASLRVIVYLHDTLYVSAFMIPQ